MAHANPQETLFHEFHEQRVRANGLGFRVLEWRPTAFEATAMLLHGYMDAAATWRDVAAGLCAAGLRVVVPDLRGYGDSDRAPPGSYYHFPDYVADVAGLVAALVPAGPLFLVGHSMGGTIASLYAGAFPDRVARLALLEGIGPPDGTFESMPDRMRRWIEQTAATRDAEGRSIDRSLGTREQALRRLSGNHPGVSGDVLSAHLDELTRPDGRGGVVWKGDPLHKPISPMPFFARGYLEFASRVSCPVLFLSGSASAFHPEDEETRLARFRTLTRTVIEGAGHMMHWTHPAELADELVAFWTSTLGG